MGVKISELVEKTTANSSDVIPIVDTGTKKITKENLLKEITNSIETINTKLTNLGNYSTKEINTGKKWIDGKPIYRKVLELTSDTEQQIISHNIADVEHIWVSGDSFLDVHGKTSIPANYYRDSGIYAYAHANLNNIFIKASPPSWKGNKFYIVLEYTKKTD